MSGPFFIASSVVSLGSTLTVLAFTDAALAPSARASSCPTIAATIAFESSFRPFSAATTPTIRPPRVLRYLAEMASRLTALAMRLNDGALPMAVSSMTGHIDPSARGWKVIQRRTADARIVQVRLPSLTLTSWAIRLDAARASRTSP